MGILFIIITTLVWVLYTLAMAMRPRPSQESLYELKRRAHHSARAQALLDREKVLPSLVTVWYLITSVLLISAALLTFTLIGWLLGIVTTLGSILIARVIMTRQGVIRRARQLFMIIEPSLVRFLQKRDRLFQLFSDETGESAEQYRRFDSREELVHLIDHSGEALTEDERHLLSHGLTFASKNVKGSMVPRAAIESIDKKEFLGPLVLSELYRSGHRFLPVIHGDLDHIVGMLPLAELLSLETKRSTTAEKAMSKTVAFIHQDDSLEQALAMCLRTQQHLLIVTNEKKKTMGLISLGDIIEALVGRRITSESDV